jgi:hypothetical protein
MEIIRHPFITSFPSGFSFHAYTRPCEAEGPPKRRSAGSTASQHLPTTEWRGWSISLAIVGLPSGPGYVITAYGAPGVFGGKFTVHPLALAFTDLSSSGDQKGYPKAAPSRPAKSRLLAHA